MVAWKQMQSDDDDDDDDDDARNLKYFNDNYLGIFDKSCDKC